MRHKLLKVLSFFYQNEDNFCGKSFKKHHFTIFNIIYVLLNICVVKYDISYGVKCQVWLALGIALSQVKSSQPNWSKLMSTQHYIK